MSQGLCAKAVSPENRLRTGLNIRLLDTVTELKDGDTLSIELPDGDAIEGHVLGGPIFRFVREDGAAGREYLKPRGEASYEYVCEPPRGLQEMNRPDE